MILIDTHSPMLDWYLTHVYVLPWWAYAVPLYLLVGASAFRVIQMIAPNCPPPDVMAIAFVVGWPFVAVLLLAYTALRTSGWLLGFTDTLSPFSPEGGRIE